MCLFGLDLPGDRPCSAKGIPKIKVADLSVESYEKSPWLRTKVAVSTINLIPPDHLQELHAPGPVLACVPDRESAGRTLVARLSAILDAPALLVERRARSWQTVAAIPDLRAVPHAGVIGDAWQSAVRPGKIEHVVTKVTLAEANHWTCLSVGKQGGEALVLAFGGDWTLSEKPLAEFAEAMSKALESVRAHRAGRSSTGMTATYELARRLAQTNDRNELYQLIVDTCARAVGAEKTSRRYATTRNARSSSPRPADIQPFLSSIYGFRQESASSARFFWRVGRSRG